MSENIITTLEKNKTIRVEEVASRIAQGLYTKYVNPEQISTTQMDKITAQSIKAAIKIVEGVDKLGYPQ